MKKILVVTLFVALAFSAFAQMEMSAGLGYEFQAFSINTKASIMGGLQMNGKLSTSYSNIFAFFDATYVEATLGMQFIGGKNTSTVKIDGLGTISETVDNPSMTNLAIGVLGKYPFEITPAISVFPALGFEYDLNIAAEGKDDMSSDEKAELNMFFIKAGVGADFAVTEKIYLRPSVLFAYKIPGEAEKNAIKDLESSGADSVSINTLRWDIGLSVGYKF